MPFDIAYATVDDYKAEQKMLGTTRDDAIARDLRAISRVIDTRTGRKFGNSDTIEQRIFYPQRQNRGQGFSGMRPTDWAESENPWRHSGNSRTLTVNDIANVQGLRVVADANRDGLFTGDPDLALTQLELLPLNAVYSGEPYTHITIPDWSQLAGFAPNQKILVEAIYGWPAIPEAVTRATIDLCAILRLESARATRTMNDLNQVLSTTPAAAQCLATLAQAYSRKAGLFDL